MDTRHPSDLRGKENTVYEQNNVCISCISDSPHLDNSVCRGRLSIIERSQEKLIIWRPCGVAEGSVTFSDPIEIKLSTLKAFRQTRPRLGGQYSCIIFMSDSGQVFPPMEFRSGGSKNLVNSLSAFMSITKSTTKPHTFETRLYKSSALLTSYDALELFDQTRSEQAEQFVSPTPLVHMSGGNDAASVGNAGRSAVLEDHRPSSAAWSQFTQMTDTISQVLRNMGSSTSTPPVVVVAAGTNGQPEAGEVNSNGGAAALTGVSQLGTVEYLGFEVVTKGASVDLPPRQTVHRGPPLSLEQWNRHLDPEGRVTCVGGLLEKIFRGGLEESLRPIVWKYLLGYYQWNDTAAQNEQRQKLKQREYFNMKLQWKYVTEEQEKRFALMRERKSLIEKDVHRTDRGIDQYRRTEDGNLSKLYDILLTYTMYNFDLGYVQGMNDLLAPILVLIPSEQDAFWCFAGLMERMEGNFKRDQSAMKRQFIELFGLFQVLDPTLSAYLKSQTSEDMFFCFRWLLIHFKREFEYTDLMRLWEVLWTDLPCSNFFLLVAVAIVDDQRKAIIDNQLGYNEILKHVNELSRRIPVEATLAKAESIYLQLRACWSQLPEDIREVLTCPPLSGSGISMTTLPNFGAYASGSPPVLKSSSSPRPSVSKLEDQQQPSAASTTYSDPVLTLYSLSSSTSSVSD